MDDDESVDDDFGEAIASSLTDGGKKCTVFLIDGSPKMFEKYRRNNSNVPKTCKYFYAVIFLKTSFQQLKSHTIDHIYVVQEVEEISAERIIQLNQIISSEDILSTFKSMCGGHGHCDYSEALFFCIKQMTGKMPYFRKRIVYLLTNETDLFDANDQHRISTCKTVDDLRSHDIEFSVYPLISENDAVPKKQYARRNITSVDFELGDGLKFSVGIYSLLHSEKIAQPAILNAERNEILQRSHVYVNKETNEEVPLLEKEIILQRQIGGETVNLSADEIEKLRRLAPPGILLLGFKPLSCLKITHHVRSSQFVYPFEKHILGSVRMYRALYEVCTKLKKMIICRYIQKVNVPPKLVALVPQTSVTNDNSEGELSSKFCYPGFHLVYLPFREDKRDISEQMTHPHGEWPVASKVQIETARKFVKKLTAGYFPEKFCNPVLQKHYKVIEALALDYDEVPAVQDQIQPYFLCNDFRKRVEKELDELRTCVLLDGYNSEHQTSKKVRKADELS
uniref:ATP-dependent DNA helicase 2 subunit 1 n=1 Tax=Setaria digitata TaxID=48799 RepID=A0A915PHE5_9BILA